jgi:hypothetical protein
MSGSGNFAPGFGRGAARFKIAALLAVIGIIIMFIAVRFEARPFLKSSPLEQRGVRYSRVWIDNADQPVGAIVEGGQLTVERWDGSKWATDFGTKEAPAWAISPDFRRIAWIAGGWLHSAADNGTKVAMDLGQREAAAAGALSDGSVTAVFRDGSTARWDETGRSLGTSRTGLNRVDQAVIEGGYMAAASYQTRTVMLYRFETDQWKPVEQASAPDPPFQLLLPAPGVVAELLEGAFHIGDETRNTPGTSQSATAELLDLIATGNFEGVYVLPPKSEHYRLADAEPGSIVAASHTRLVVSGPKGTSLFTLAGESRLSTMGRSLSNISLALIGLAALTALSGLLFDALSRWLGGKSKLAKNIRIPGALADPPVELIRAVAYDECVVWAGAGVGAQAGYPLREAFVAMLTQTAAVESWVPPALAQKLQGMCARGKAEEAINELMQRAPEQRGKVVEFIRSTYGRFGVPSRTHELIAKLKFPATVTTNYDLLLEQMRDVWINHTLTLSDPPAGAEFAVKLYGNLRAPRTLLLSRAEFGSAAGTSPMGNFIAQALETRTVLFVGCSTEGLLADLSQFNVGPKPVRTHYAVVGVSGSAWQSHADQLSRRYGIELLVCDAEQMPKALPNFLARLLEEVDRVHKSTGVEQATSK